MTYETLHRAVLNGTARQATATMLADIATGRTRIDALTHPLGFACLPLVRDGARGVCVHAWLDEPPTTSFIHAHSWDLISYVLYGAVRNTVHEITEAATDPTHRVVEIHSAAMIDEIRPTDRTVRSAVRTNEITSGGGVYTLGAGIFHTAQAIGRAATLAFGSGRPGAIDLSLGDLDTATHRVERRRCDPVQTARITRAVLEQITDGAAAES